MQHSTTQNIVASAREFIDSTRGRVIGFGLAFGFVPFYFLSSVLESLRIVMGH